MTVHVPGGAPSVDRSAGGFLWRIRGPVANESEAETAARNRRLAAHPIAWLPVIGILVYLARLFISPRSPAFWLVVGLAGVSYARGWLGGYLLRRPFLWKPVWNAVILTVLVVAVMGLAGEPTEAFCVLLPAALLAASAAARRIAREHARWLAEDLDLSWEQRDALAARADSLPVLPLRLLVAYTFAFVVHLASLRVHVPHRAGVNAILALIAAHWAVPWFCGRPVVAPARSAARALVLWLSYNHHEWYGPQTFQFEGAFRRPIARRILLWGTTLVLAAACVAAVSDPAGSRMVSETLDGGAVWLYSLQPDPENRRIPDRILDDLALTPAEQAFMAQLPSETERQRYWSALATRRLDEKQRRDRSRKQAALRPGTTTLPGWFLEAICALLCPPLLLFTAVAGMSDAAVGDE
jgi:hypothetical protein